MKRLETADDQFVTITAYHTAEQSSTPPVEKTPSWVITSQKHITHDFVEAGQTDKSKLDSSGTARPGAEASFLPGLN
jgi:hypothetical protein